MREYSWVGWLLLAIICAVLTVAALSGELALLINRYGLSTVGGVTLGVVGFVLTLRQMEREYRSRLTVHDMTIDALSNRLDSMEGEIEEMRLSRS